MIPVSGLHFLVTLAYLILAMGGLKIAAVALHDRPVGQALGFLLF